MKIKIYDYRILLLSTLLCLIFMLPFLYLGLKYYIILFIVDFIASFLIFLKKDETTGNYESLGVAFKG